MESAGLGGGIGRASAESCLGVDIYTNILSVPSFITFPPYYLPIPPEHPPTIDYPHMLDNHRQITYRCWAEVSPRHLGWQLWDCRPRSANHLNHLFQTNHIDNKMRPDDDSINNIQHTPRCRPINPIGRWMWPRHKSVNVCYLLRFSCMNTRIELLNCQFSSWILQ
jgi:hypothetical protein